MKPDKILTIAVTAASILFIAGTTIGTLAIPVVLAMYFSWYWLFLYMGYALVILYVAMYCVNYRYESRMDNCNNSRYGGSRR